MVAILIERRALAAIGCDAADPGVGGLAVGDAFARRRVHPFAYVNFDFGVIFVGVLFALERFDMAIAVRVGVVNNPSLFRLAGAGLTFLIILSRFAAGIS